MTDRSIQRRIKLINAINNKLRLIAAGKSL